MPIRIIHRGGRLGLKGWIAVLLALALALGILFAITLVAVGIFLFLLPVIALGAAGSALMWVFGRRRKAPPGEPEIIDAHYRIIDETSVRGAQRPEGEA